MKSKSRQAEKGADYTVAFKMLYPIETRLLKTIAGAAHNRRPGTFLEVVVFVVAHDTGNKNSTAYGNIDYYAGSLQADPTASAQTFIDHLRIVECIPATVNTIAGKKVERAYHVRKNVTTDNAKYGANANDSAIGVELCFFDDPAKNAEAYARYVWYLAYLCYLYGLNPLKDIVGHDVLDPGRKIDPTNGLRVMGKTFADLIRDVAAQYTACSGKGVTYVPTTNASSASTLRKGDTGTDVAKLQTKLSKLGYGVTSDGDFGAATEDAVRAFQKDAGLAADGIAGPATQAKLSEEVARFTNAQVKEDDKLTLSTYQWTSLVTALERLKEKGKFNDQSWIDKAKAKTLTQSELLWLNTIIVASA